MRSLIVAAVAGIVAFLAIGLPWKLGYAILPAVAVLVGVYILLARHHSKAVEAIFQRMGEEIQQQRIDNAIRVLGEAYPHCQWVFLLGSQVDGQIGVLHYMKKDWDAALPLLEKAWVKHWLAKGMLAAHWFRHHKAEQAMDVLDKAIAASKKEALLYGLKAFMKVKLKDRDAARAALVAGQAALPKSEPIASNLSRLQNGEDLRMWEFGDAWWSLHLEKPSQKALAKIAGTDGLQPRGLHPGVMR